eukprot:s5728_g4.t1
MEQPEDLGALPRPGVLPEAGRRYTVTPQLADLLEKGLRTVAFHQASFGVPYTKPTRLLLCTSLDMPDFVYEGLPSYDDQGYYKGPLPLHRVSVRCSSVKLKGPSRLPVLNSGPWLCASGFPLCCSRRACSPLKTPLERGAPLRPTISYRWPHHARSYADGSSWDWLRDRMLKLIMAKVGSEEQLEKEAFRMAAGGEQGCSLASDPELQSQLRQLWKEWLEAQDLSEPGLLEDSPRLRGTAKVAAGKRSMGGLASVGDFLDHYGIHTAVAALAVVVEDEAEDKKRIIHDATHGLRLNHRIKCRDKLREKKHLLREHEEAGEVDAEEETLGIPLARRFTPLAEARYLVGQWLRGLAESGKAEARPSHATDQDPGPGRLQKPEPLVEGAAPLCFFTDAKADDGRAWIGGFLELVDGCQGPWFSLEVTPEWAPWAFAKGDPGKVWIGGFLELVDGCQGPWFSLEVTPEWAPWAFAKGDPGKVIAPGHAVGIRLWVPEGNAKKTSPVAIRGYTDNQFNEALLRKAMTTKFPSTLILMELAEELSAKKTLEVHMPTLLADRAAMWPEDPVEVASLFSASSMPTSVSVPTASICRTTSWVLSTTSPAVDKESVCNQDVVSMHGEVGSPSLEASEVQRRILDPSLCREELQETRV